MTRPAPDMASWMAARTIAMHTEELLPPIVGRATTGCAQCTPTGCPLLAQALRVRSEAILRHPRTVSEASRGRP